MHEAIKKRISIRSYAKKPLSPTDRRKISEILEDARKKTGPFNHQVRFFFVGNKDDGGKKIGTYGFVKNPPAFVGGVVENTREGMVDFGFLFEEVILRLTEENLGTVWLGGTFHRSDFDVETDGDTIIPAVSPVGYPAERSLREKVIRGMARSDKRKPFDELFFSGVDLSPVDDKHPYRKYLEAVRAAPSASNKQPWRIIMTDDVFHVYLKRTQGYGKNLPVDIQAIDIGIALSHVVLPLEEDDNHPTFVKRKPTDVEGWEYVLSIRA